MTVSQRTKERMESLTAEKISKTQTITGWGAAKCERELNRKRKQALRSLEIFSSPVSLSESSSFHELYLAAETACCHKIDGIRRMNCANSPEISGNSVEFRGVEPRGSCFEFRKLKRPSRRP